MTQNSDNSTLTRASLSATVHHKVNVPLSDATEAVDTLIDEIINTLASGEEVKLSSFGTFFLRKKKQRIGRNPKTKVEVAIPPRTVIAFTPSNILRKAVNEA